MKRICVIQIVPIILAVMVLGCDRSVAQTVQESRAASALFGDFETVFYSKSHLLSSPHAYKQLSKLEARNLRFPFAYVQGALDSLESPASDAVLASSDSILLGAKDFLPPAGLGPVRSQRCYVVVLKNRSAFDLSKYFHTTSVVSAAGMPVRTWTAKLGEFGENDQRPSALYAVQVGQSYVLVANDLKELQFLAKHLASTGLDSHTLSEIREWESVSQQEVWGYRRYRHTGIVDTMAAGMADVTPGAEALIFFLNSDKRTAVLRLLASDDSTTEKINAEMAKANIAWPPLKPSGPGTWETTISFSGDENSADRTFIVVGLFGFPVYL